MFEDIIEMIELREFKEALTQLIACVSKTNDWQLKNECENLSTSYDLMLQYTLNGMKDPQKESLYKDMLLKAFNLTDRARIATEAMTKSNAYLDHYRLAATRPPHSFPELQMMLEDYTESKNTFPLIFPNEAVRKKKMAEALKKYTDAIDELFYKVWVNTQWSEAEMSQALELLRSPLVDGNALSVMISGVTMSLLACFDRKKTLFLCHACRHEDLQVNVRAKVGLLIICYLFYSRLELLSPKEGKLLSVLTESDDADEELLCICMQVLITKNDTEKVNEIMRDEIIPKLKNNPLLKDSQLGIDESLNLEEGNPEWEKWIEESKLDEKFRKLSELQMEGADIYMGTFAQLKNFPFFQETPHWFYPFNPDLAHMTDWPKSQFNSLIKVLINSPMFCNSDKYSFCYTLNEMSKQQKKLVETQISNSIGYDDLDALQQEELLSRLMQFKNIARNYIQDLYRYFKLWKGPRVVRDIFKDPLDLWESDWVCSYLCATGKSVPIADFLSTHKGQSGAYYLYLKTVNQSEEKDASLYQKAGYMSELQRHYSDAIKYYSKADMLEPDNAWNVLHWVQCLRTTRRFEEALQLCDRMESKEPDNLKITMQKGLSLMDLGRYEEALNSFYKVEYLEKNARNAYRGIGWCCMMSKQYEKAKKYYDLLTADPKAKMEDWINAGHVSYLLGDARRAVDCYNHVVCDKATRKQFDDIFERDEHDLVKLGLTHDELSILKDAMYLEK